jgi:hypothetical protein
MFVACTDGIGTAGLGNCKTVEVLVEALAAALAEASAADWFGKMGSTAGSAVVAVAELAAESQYHKRSLAAALATVLSGC